VIPKEFDDFFTAAASVSGALIGLLFVAITVTPEHAHREETRVMYHLRAASALLLFSNVLTVGLVALVPGASLGWWVISISVGVIAFALASVRSAAAESTHGARDVQVLRLSIGTLAIAAFEIWAGVLLIQRESDSGAISMLDYVVIVCLVAGIGRTWALMSMRNTGLFASLRVLAKGEGALPPGLTVPDGSAAAGGDAAESRTPAPGEEPGREP
jgi:hypothetical protein